MQFLALYEQGKNVIYFEHPQAPFAGRCGYNRLVLSGPYAPATAHEEEQHQHSGKYVAEYDPKNTQHEQYICLGCAQHIGLKMGDLTPCRVKYHFEPFPE